MIRARTIQAEAIEHGPGARAMKHMNALQYTAIGSPPEIREVPTPQPGPGEVLLKMTAAGVCHSDEYFMGLPAEEYGFGLPLTLGHEGAGIVAGLGAGALGVSEGDPVAVYGAWGCGNCRACATGAENECLNAADLHIQWPGLGAPGCMAEYMLVPSPRHLVPLGDLDPVRNVPLTDAGLTPYHAIKPSLPKLVPGSTAVVIGVGGLGHLAIQILRAMSPACVVALDLLEDKLALAREVGAHATFPSDPSSIEAVRELADGHGAQAVFDFVGSQATADLAAGLVGVASDIVMVGLGPGAVRVGQFTLPDGSSARTSTWGTRSELFEVLDLARSGALVVETESFSLEDGPRAYERLHARTLRGRAVLIP
jgi:propanol-preferring alcohol dehydrogenase